MKKKFNKNLEIDYLGSSKLFNDEQTPNTAKNRNKNQTKNEIEFRR